MSPDPTLKAWFTTTEASRYTGASVSTLERGVAAGELPFSQRQARGTRRFHRDDLDAWVRGELPAGAL